MADEKKPKEPKVKKSVEGKAKPAEGKAKGAAAAPAAPPAEAPPPVAKPHTLSTKVPKLQKKNKSRLPRKQKKAQEKLSSAKR